MFRFRARTRRPISNPHRRLWLHSLEERSVPSTFVVDRNTDSATDGTGLVGSLRYCLTAANANAQADTITFSGVSAITLSNGELAITEAGQALTIDGAGAVTLTAGSAARHF